MLVIAAGGVLIALRSQLSGITHIKRIDTTHQPPKYTTARNILLLGSDTRTGHNAAIGGKVGCDCSDTIMVAHISPGRKRVIVLSIPRDTVVPQYACAPYQGRPGQQADPYVYERINATLAYGGPECVRETVEQQTGIYIDNVIELNFTGFEHVINDLGGVNVCLPFAIDNVVTGTEGSGLHLSAGRHHIDGKVALQFWRTRYNVADGSDIARIARDQYLMAQIVKGVLHSGLLRSPTKAYTVLGDVADAMTTDASDTDLVRIALSLRGISPKGVQFITAPWAAYPYDPNEVEFAQPQADAVFWAIAHDTALPPESGQHKHGHQHGGGKNGGGSPSIVPASPVSTVSPVVSPSPSASASPATTAGPIMPSQVTLTVLDGSTGTNQTATVAAALTSRGFSVLGTGYAALNNYHRVVVEYGSVADLPAAKLVQAQFTGARLKLDAAAGTGTVEVMLGSSFTALAPATPTSQSSLNSLSTSYGGINASVHCRNSAFYGTFDTPNSGQNSCPCQ